MAFEPLPAPITRQDIENVWRPLSEAEALLVDGLATQAWIRLLVHRPQLPANVADGSVTHEALQSALVSMIIRVLKNPDSVRQLSKSYDDWSKSQTFDSSVSTGELYANEHELALVTPASTIPERGAYTVSFWG